MPQVFIKSFFFDFMVLSDGNIYREIFSQRPDNNVPENNPRQNEKLSKIKNPVIFNDWETGIIGYDY